jgi:hypothetical protein
MKFFPLILSATGSAYRTELSRKDIGVPLMFVSKPHISLFTCPQVPGNYPMTGNWLPECERERHGEIHALTPTDIGHTNSNAEIVLP